MQSIATFIVVLYSVLTYHVEACHAAYNYWAVLALDIFAIIFWLSSMGYLAATRSGYIFPVVYDGIICPYYYDSYDCAIKKRDIDLMKRDVANYPYLNMMSASAGLAGLEMFLSLSLRFPWLARVCSRAPANHGLSTRILFIVTLAIFGVLLHRHRSSGAPNTSSPGKLEAHPMGTTPTAQVQQAQPQPEYAPPGQ
jgi:hypothetical protein